MADSFGERKPILEPRGNKVLGEARPKRHRQTEKNEEEKNINGENGGEEGRASKGFRISVPGRR